MEMLRESESRESLSQTLLEFVDAEPRLPEDSAQGAPI